MTILRTIFRCLFFWLLGAGADEETKRRQRIERRFMGPAARMMRGRK